MRLYHTTYDADRILAEGFKDVRGTYLANRVHEGVWFADRPLDENEGADGDVLLVLSVPAKKVRPYEWVEEGKPYREFLIPAALANQHGPPKVADAFCPGNSREELFRFASQIEAHGTEYLKKHAARVRELIPFLAEHGLLRNERAGKSKAK
jgi:hypothetical protein